eukprot:3499823-Rhodomonas_salina.1
MCVMLADSRSCAPHRSSLVMIHTSPASASKTSGGSLRVGGRGWASGARYPVKYFTYAWLDASLMSVPNIGWTDRRNRSQPGRSGWKPRVAICRRPTQRPWTRGTGASARVLRGLVPTDLARASGPWTRAPPTLPRTWPAGPCTARARSVRETRQTGTRRRWLRALREAWCKIRVKRRTVNHRSFLSDGEECGWVASMGCSETLGRGCRRCPPSTRALRAESLLAVASNGPVPCAKIEVSPGEAGD